MGKRRLNGVRSLGEGAKGKNGAEFTGKETSGFHKAETSTHWCLKFYAYLGEARMAVDKATVGNRGSRQRGKRKLPKNLTRGETISSETDGKDSLQQRRVIPTGESHASTK